MTDLCTKCTSVIPLNATNCPVCNTPQKPPNVRMAERSEEVEALDERLATANTKAELQGTSALLQEFNDAVNGSAAVMNRHLATLHSWMQDASPLFVSFHRQLEAGRQPNENEWDEQRGTAEQAINPFCYRDINFAALTLDGLGMTYYGAYSVFIRELTIEDRATVFEQNPFYFNKRFNIVAGVSPPRGYRATWSNRGKIAVAKLHDKITAATQATEFPDVLLEPKRASEDCDFIEVHIFGPINRAGIELVKGPTPKRREDKALWRDVTRKLRALSVDVETTA